jgi:hypothetical protein
MPTPMTIPMSGKVVNGLLDDGFGVGKAISEVLPLAVGVPQQGIEDPHRTNPGPQVGPLVPFPQEPQAFAVVGVVNVVGNVVAYDIRVVVIMLNPPTKLYSSG